MTQFDTHAAFKPPSQQTVVVGMSGGVDSSVAALLLKQQGYRVIGMFMKNWEEKDENGVCTSAADFRDVEKVCAAIDIPYYTVEFVQEYWDNVFTDFIKNYKAGFTPNPDILCNREIKFNLFLKKALELGADFLATGHYARIDHSGLEGAPRLLKGVDPGKDQSYFIYTLNSRILSQVLFPIGHLLKSEVREIARSHGIPTAEKKDSTGICFIGERNFRKFLAQYIPSTRGEILSLEGERVGMHQGSAYYTLGQRKGLGLGGEGDAWFVVSKDAERNRIYVARGESHPALFCDELYSDDFSWVAGVAPRELEIPGASIECQAKARYRQKDAACRVSRMGERIRVIFDHPQRAVTPGQSVVLYQGEICLGGGIISACGPSHYEQALLNQNRTSQQGAALQF